MTKQERFDGGADGGEVGQIAQIHQFPGGIERRVESRRVVFLRWDKERGGKQRVKMTCFFFMQVVLPL